MDNTSRQLRSQSLLIALMTALPACGREDSIWGGISGVILFILIVWACIHFIRK